MRLISDRPRIRTSASAFSGCLLGAPAQKAADTQIRTCGGPGILLLQQRLSPQEVRPQCHAVRRLAASLKHVQRLSCSSSCLTHGRDDLQVLAKSQNLRTSHLSHSPPRSVTFLDPGAFDSSISHTNKLQLTRGPAVSQKVLPLPGYILPVLQSS